MQIYKYQLILLFNFIFEDRAFWFSKIHPKIQCFKIYKALVAEKSFFDFAHSKLHPLFRGCCHISCKIAGCRNSFM